MRSAVDWVSASQRNVVDAVTGATLRSHGPASADWDCSDVSGQPVAPGPYQVCMELEEEDVSGFFGGTAHTTCVPFDTSMGPVMTTGPDGPTSTGIQISVQ